MGHFIGFAFTLFAHQIRHVAEKLLEYRNTEIQKYRNIIINSGTDEYTNSGSN